MTTLAPSEGRSGPSAQIAATILTVGAVLACGLSTPAWSDALPAESPVAGAPLAQAPSPYRAVAVAGAGTVARLRADLGGERFRMVLAINRVDATWAARADTLWVPDPGMDPDRLSPFPERVARADSVSRLLIVSPRVQAFAAYANGVRVRWGPTSTGARTSPTPTGWFRANWKSERHVSTVDPTWVMPWCVNFENQIGMALHAYALPGRPESHCCVRLLDEDARWVFGWVSTWTLSQDGRRVVERGTPMLVVGEYDFDAAPPWSRLGLHADAANVRNEEIEAAWDSTVASLRP